MFGDLRDDRGDHSKTQLISERMDYMSKGQWESLWNMVGQRVAGDEQEGKEIPQGARE